MHHKVNEMNKRIEDEPVFLLRGEDDEIYYIDDIEMINTLEAKVKSMKGKSDDEIGSALLAIVNPERYGR
jgi:hypothetical protein